MSQPAPTRTKTLLQLWGILPSHLLPQRRLVPSSEGKRDAVLFGLAYDSRQVAPGDLFVALVGERFDGHDYLAHVVAAGASALVVQEDRVEKWQSLNLPVPLLVVPNCRAVLAPLATTFYDNPTQNLYLAGVTGTNGKTTTVRMIDSIARANGDVTGTIGTLGATVAGRALPGDRTTPEAPDLQKLFRAMVDAGAKSAAMEVASHALALGRTEGCLFDVGVFTNLTQDHLDFHGTMDNYRDAKGKLFTDYAKAAKVAGKKFTAVINADDPAADYYSSQISEINNSYSDGRAIVENTYGKFKGERGNPDFYFKPDEVVLKIDGLQFTVYLNPDKAWRDLRINISLPFGGAFNIYNALAAVGYGVARRVPLEVIAEGLASCPPVPGRFEPVKAGQDFAVLVDYAHTPDGLQNVLQSARPLTSGKLWVVFGCGGNRDKTKRPLMGKIACDLADVALATSDNPRRENPESILDDVLAGMAGGGAQVIREADRRKAIALAVQGAKAGDTVVIAGKGHEDYQIIGDETFPFSDVTVAREEIAKCLAH